MKLTLGQIADWIHAEGVFDTRAEALGYSIDSRTIAAGDLFFAVHGDRMDGHDYVQTALNDGAIAAVVSMRWLAPSAVDEAKLIRVPDDDEPCVLYAMQRLAHEVRMRWGKRVIGVTGSAGKTTTKDCIATVLATQFKVLKTEGNLNNHFGVPLTLLRLEPEHDVAVVEMGMNHAGEIAALAKIAEPNWGVVSNVGTAHIEFFEDGIKGVARAKRELIESLPGDGLAFLNGDDARVRAFADGLGDRAVLYGTTEGCRFLAAEIKDKGLHGSDFQLLIPNRETPVPVALRLPGRHNVLNALAAFAVGFHAGLDIFAAVKALESTAPTEKRGNVLQFRGAEIVNDTYNSNPGALMSMIDALKHTQAKRRILVAGEMLELGDDGPELHRACGAAAATAGLEIVVGVRGLASHLVDAAKEAGVPGVFFDTPEMAGEWLLQSLSNGDVVLLKASRGVRLERALAVLQGGKV